MFACSQERTRLRRHVRPIARVAAAIILVGGDRPREATHDVVDDAAEIDGVGRRRERVGQLRGRGRPHALLEDGARLGRARAEEARRARARVRRVWPVRIRIRTWVGRRAAAATVAGAPRDMRREGVVVICVGEGRARLRQVHALPGEEGRA